MHRYTQHLLLGLAHRILYEEYVYGTLYDVYAVLKKSPYLPYKLVLNGYTIYTIFARAGAVNWPAHSMAISVSPGLARPFLTLLTLQHRHGH
jgi:hypothetical protein